MSEYQKPLPEPTPLSQPFWEGVRQHKLLVQKCASCSKLRHTPRPLCPSCLSQEFTWAPLSGQGQVYSYTVMHRAPAPGFQEELPYVVALVELKEGVRMISNVVGCTPQQVRVGMPVKVVYEDINDKASIFKFAPAR
ncbi:MAG: Zn-ribbon domain-containing OB-fold protein [Dehalococcoidia bacterium]|nr:Zn-ribbon domain-containing OB-fold protein [Dehalococcoidia bacterium]